MHGELFCWVALGWGFHLVDTGLQFNGYFPSLTGRQRGSERALHARSGDFESSILRSLVGYRKGDISRLHTGGHPHVLFAERDFDIVPYNRLLDVVCCIFETLANAMKHIFGFVDD